MISLRHHAISIAAIFLALAVGVALGSGTLSNGLLTGLRDDKAELQGDVRNLQERNNQLTEQLNSADGFDAAVSGRVVRGALAGRSVMIVTTPDADPGDLDGVIRMIGQAGGTVTGRLSLTDAFVAAVNGDQLRTTVTNVIPAGIQLQTGAVDQGSLAGDLMGSVLLLNRATAKPQSTPEERALALETLRSGGFISYEDGSIAPAQAAIVITRRGKTDDEAGGNSGALIARFAGAMHSRGAGTVLAGRQDAAIGNGAIAVVRADAALSAALTTVDNIDREAGKITTVLAVQEQLGGKSGRYGTGPNSASVTVGAPVS